MILNIKKFRNIKSCQFEIIDNRLILVGKNSVGKSNIIDAIQNKNFSLNSNIEYSDTIYISAEHSIDNDASFEEDSVYLKLANMLDDSLSMQSQYAMLVKELDIVVAENDYLNKKGVIKYRTGNSKDDFHRCCSKLASGVKRELLYRLMYRVAIEAVDKKMIILIDSPELYAHPSLARMLCNELKFLSDRGHLVVVSTHSANVVETLTTDIRQIAKLTIDNGFVQSYQVDLDDYTSRIKEFYQTKNIFSLPNGRANLALSHIVKDNLESFCKSFLRASVLKILFADYVLLGEGSSEEVLFNYIFTRMDFDLSYKLSKMNVDYVTGFGKFYLPFYFILANLYGVKVLCMFDVDNLENKSHKAFYNAFSYYEINNKEQFATIMLDPDLESELDIIQSKHRVEKPLHIFNEVVYKNNNVAKIVEKIENALNIL